MHWYVDGELFSTITSKEWFSKAAPDNSKAPFDQPFHIILNLAVGGKWPEENNDDGYFSMDYPKSLEVDFVRVYQCKSPPDAGKCSFPKE